MLSTIFQPEVSALESQVAQLQAQIAAHAERIILLNEAEFVTGGSLEALRSAIEKVSSLAPGALANLRTAVLSLFSNDDQPGNDNNGSQSANPAPDAPTSGIELGTELQPNDGISIISAIHEPSPERCELASWLTCDVINGQKSDLIDRSWHELIHQKFTQSELTCLLEDAPVESLQGQAVEIACQSEDKSELFIELIRISDVLAYQRRHDGEIICVYVGFNNKATARRWGEWLAVHHSVASGFEVREAKRLSGVKHELKLWGMSLKQIERLSQCNFSKDPRNSFSEAPQRQLETVPPAHPKVEAGDIVASTLVPTWHYEVLEILGDGKLSCRRLGVQPDLVVSQSEWSVTLVSKAQACVRIESKPLTVGEISAEEALASIQPPLEQEFSYSLLEASNLDQRWSVSRSTPECKQQILGSVSCGSNTQRWSHSRQPKYGQNISYYPSKETAAEALAKAYDRDTMPRLAVAAGIEPDF